MPNLSIRLHTWFARLGRTGHVVEELPLRSELFSVEQLARHARELASNHPAVAQHGSTRLLDRLDVNEDSLRDFNRSTLAISTRRTITPAAEWFVDSYYLVEEQIHLARLHMPGGYIRELPRFPDGPSRGLPRVYDIVVELIAHVDAQVDAGSLSAFVAAYQTVNPLKLGELWAIPIMLRLGLIEDLQRITKRLTTARADRTLARVWVDRLQDMAETNPSHLIIVIAEMAQADLPMSSAFVSEFYQHLSRQSLVLHMARGWLDQRLAQQGLSIELLVQAESQNQASDQVSVSHCLGSLRFLGAMNWKEFVETLSLVESTLRNDPSDVYRSMDFATRDSYRHAVEYFARYSGLTENVIARTAVELAEGNARKNGPKDIGSHVGFHLIGPGKSGLERALHVHPPLKTLTERCIHRFPKTYYLGGIAAVTLSATGVFAWEALTLTMRGPCLIAFSLICLVSASQLAVALMNRLSTLLLSPILLPRLDYSFGIARECRTMVVVPTMLASPEGVDRLVGTLEIHHLSNRDPHLYFALLTDFPDAPEETLPGDKALLERARDGVGTLNRKYAVDGRALFFLLHRPRLWNRAEGVWMGFERKRGKLDAFNRLLRGGSPGSFSEIVGNTEIFPCIRYVITLDTDTQLPREAARQLVGTMAHPLNRPVFDPVRGIVTEGYAIMQPRIGVSLSGVRRSWFARLFAGDAGIDPYTREVSDVYQDVFREGSFIGKGIYDVDVFQKAMLGRFPENAILSHDLLESCHARSALVSDVEFFEAFPSRYNVDAARRHRWIRGDWQIARWLRSRVPSAGAGLVANPLSWLSQWKILDNLRRSTVPIAMIALILGSWLCLPEFGSLGLLLVISIVTIPPLLSTLTSLCRKAPDLPWTMHLRKIAATAFSQLGQVFLTMTLLPCEAFLSLDAIARTLVRVTVTRRHLLEWQTSSDSECRDDASLGSAFSALWIAPCVALAAGLFLFLTQPGMFVLSLPLIALWLAAPLLAWRISIAPGTPAPDLTAAQLKFLRYTARRTWHYFDTFACEGENWLPPDNYQEIPSPRIASRTSPTNMGLSLLANLAAADFAYITTGCLLRRTQRSLAAMQRLERYNGHFFNWYDTRTLQPLLPLYVSSVDSGNLAGHLLTLASGLREMADTIIFTPQVFAGLRDTAEVLHALTGKSPALAQFIAELEKAPATLHAAHSLLKRASDLAGKIAASHSGSGNEIGEWSRILKQGCEDHLEELRHLTPWLQSSDSLVRSSGKLDERLRQLDLAPTLRDLAALDGIFDPLYEEGPGFDTLAHSLRIASERARKRLLELESLAVQCDGMAVMDFAFLYDQSKALFSIGFNVSERRRDNSFYDLLASEARLCSYVAIALGQVPQEHWFSMGRQIITSMGTPILLSWNGSMFEYLMPLLVMPNCEDTLLDHSCKAAVQHQIDYGSLRNVPWGVSESAYNRTDGHLNYQYSAFGVPGLGLKRGLADDLVIAPYASVMALMVAPRQACENLQRLSAKSLSGAYGFHDAVDYTPAHLPPNTSSVVVRCFMAHHEGMSLLALANFFHGNSMHRRFMACPLLKATNLLLQERVPTSSASVLNNVLTPEQSRRFFAESENVMRVCANPSPPAPEIHLLSNGRYHVVITSAGGGYSRWRDLAVTRWREDTTRDCWGSFVYLRDMDTGEFGSFTHQPTLRAARTYEAIFTQARAEFRLRQYDLDTHTEICVSPEDDVELRRITIANRSSAARVVELTTYLEAVLASQASDEAHPAFGNLFVQTEFLSKSSALLCTRRASSPEERPPWLLHMMLCPKVEQGGISCETDRSKFVGRGRSLESPAAMQSSAPLSNTAGSVLDPILSLRRTVSIPPHETVVVHIMTGVAENREGALAYVE